MSVHTRSESRDSNVDSVLSNPDVPPISSSVSTSSSSTGPINALVASMQSLTTIDPGVQAVLSSQIILIQTLMKNVSDSEHLVHSTTQTVQTLERKLHYLELSAVDNAPTSAIDDLGNELTNLKKVVASETKVSALESEVKTLKKSLPTPKHVNFQSITDVSKLQISVPSQLPFGLASKTVKLKDLYNSLMNLTFKSDQIADIKHMYSMICQAIDFGYLTSLLLPDIEHEKDVPDFFVKLVPPPTHTFYGTILASYK